MPPPSLGKLIASYGETSRENSWLNADHLRVPRGPCRMCKQCPGLPGVGRLFWPRLPDEDGPRGFEEELSEAGRCRRCDCPAHQHQNLELWLMDVKLRAKQLRQVSYWPGFKAVFDVILWISIWSKAGDMTPTLWESTAGGWSVWLCGLMFFSAKYILFFRLVSAFAFATSFAHGGPWLESHCLRLVYFDRRHLRSSPLCGEDSTSSWRPAALDVSGGTHQLGTATVSSTAVQVLLPAGHKRKKSEILRFNYTWLKGVKTNWHQDSRCIIMVTWLSHHMLFHIPHLTNHKSHIIRLISIHFYHFAFIVKYVVRKGFTWQTSCSISRTTSQKSW